MLDIMELRGFSLEGNAFDVFLVTPDKYKYVVVRSSLSSHTKAAFTMFESLNKQYP